MPWDDEADRDLLAYFRHLGELRRQFPEITAGERKVVHLDVQNGTYAYVQTSEANAVMVALNTSKRSRTINVPVSPSQTPVKDLLNGNSVTASGDSVSVSLPAQSGAFIA